MTVAPFTIILAFFPLIAYLTVLGLIRLSGKALVTTGGRDIAALAMAISGFLAVGPAELFFPSAAVIVLGPYVWVALITFYSLCVTLIALTSTPKLVVYGRTPEELYEPLLQAARRIDQSATGDSNMLIVTLPAASIHLRVDGQRGVDYAQILAFEPNVSLKFWNMLLANLRAETEPTPAPAPRRGVVMFLFAVALGGLVTWQALGDQELVVQGFREWLWR